MAINKILYDTNVLLDWMINSRTNYENAKKAVQQVFERKAEGFVTGHSLTDIFYIARKEMPVEKRKRFILGILNNFTILTESEKTFLEVLANPDFTDLEDGLQMQCAAEAELNYIITENVKDLSLSNIKVLTAKEFVQL